MTLFFIPKLTKRFIKKELPLSYLKNKFGFGLKEIKSYSIGSIWIHGVSLGEMKAITPFVRKLKEEYPSTPFLFTTQTTTGYQEAKKMFPNDPVFFLPIDFSFVMRPLIRAIRPKFIFFSETDLWYHLLQASSQAGGKNVIVSAKLSEKSAAWYRSIADRLFAYVDLICCQNSLYQERFRSIGVPDSKLKVTGNLKYDIKYPLSTNLPDVKNCIVLGSTHPKEEEDLLEVLPQDQTIVVVPRHPHRFQEVGAFLERKGISFYRWSQKESRPENAHVVLVDSMGKLLEFYQVAEVAIVCGSYQPIGGHNILEPLAYGTPVIFGPYMHTQFELVELVLNAQAGLQVPLENLNERLHALLENKEELQKMGENGKKLMASLQGVTEKTFAEIIALII